MLPKNKLVQQHHGLKAKRSRVSEQQRKVGRSQNEDELNDKYDLKDKDNLISEDDCKM